MVALVCEFVPRRAACEEWYDVYVRVLQDEVRALGRLPALNVPEAFVTRHPFPGERLVNST